MKIFSRKYNKKARQLSAPALRKFEAYPWPGNIRELQHTIERAVIMSDESILQPADFMFSAPDISGESLIFEDFNLETVEKILIQKTLKKHRGNISNAAKELGLTRTSLYRRMEKHGI